MNPELKEHLDKMAVDIKANMDKEAEKTLSLMDKRFSSLQHNLLSDY